MAAMRESEPTKLSVSEHQNYPVSEEYFEGHFDGNTLFPQKMRVIRIFTACKVIDNPPRDFNDLRLSELSLRQAWEAGTRMNSLHAQKGIAKFTSGSSQLKKFTNLHPQVNEQAITVPPQRFKDLWKSDVDGVLRMILQVTSNGPLLSAREDINRGQVNLIEEQDVEKINDFFSDPQNKGEIKKMQRAARLTWDFIDDNQRGSDQYVRTLSKLWLTALTPEEKRDEAIKELLQNDTARKIVIERYSDIGRYDSDALLRFLAEIDTLNKTPTNVNATDDIIFRDIKSAIESKLGDAKLPLPFGMQYEGENLKPAA